MNYCKVCNKPTKYWGPKKGWATYCSRECVNSDSDLIKQRKDTCMKKYGVDSPSKLQETKDKVKQTTLERYGVEHIRQNAAAQEKYRQTCLQRYGVDNPSKSIDIKEKKRITSLKNYGVDNPLKSEAVKSKVKKTCIQRYGVSCPLITPDSIEKLQLKRKQAIDYAWPDTVQSFNVEGYSVITTRDTYENKTIEYICPAGHRGYTLLCNWTKGARCGKCANIGTSKSEHNINNFLKSYVETEMHYKSGIHPQELDIYIPQYNLAVEYNGLYWHSELHGKDRSYHLDKTEKCKESSILLIHIFEDEWLHKQDIVKSVLLSKLGIYERRLYARQCNIKPIDYNTKKNFIDSNHLQGDCVSGINLGLYYNDKLVSVMTFGKRRYMELIRFCTLTYTQVIGSFSKMFNYFTNNTDCENIVSYADRRWFTGDIYKEVGFELSHISKPDYWYIVDDKRYHRSSFQKHKLSTKLSNFNPEISEWQNMKAHGYDRIWDCGNFVYKWRR